MKITRTAVLLLLGIMLVSGLACGGGPTQTYQLYTSINGQGSVSPSSDTFTDGDVITLIANPASGWRFDHWEGDASGRQQSVTITMNSDKTVVAYFIKIQYPISTSVSPTGSGSVSPSGGTFDAGTQVTLTATAASGWRFDHWSGDASGTSSTAVITMDSSKSVTAHFVHPPITVTLDRIETTADCEPWIIEPAEFYFVVIVTDGETTSEMSFPANQAGGDYYALGDNEGVELNTVCFSTSEVADYLHIFVAGFEQDSGICYGDFAQLALPIVAEMIQPGASIAIDILLAYINEQREGAGFWCDLDDFAGSYENTWYRSQNWGIDSHYVEGPPYLKIWFTIR